MSAVNVAGAYGKLVASGMDSGEAWDALAAPLPDIVPFDQEQARIAGASAPQTRLLGLSLGDRACFAPGITLQAPVYTADRAWKDLKVDVKIHVIR